MIIIIIPQIGFLLSIIFAYPLRNPTVYNFDHCQCNCPCIVNSLNLKIRIVNALKNGKTIMLQKHAKFHATKKYRKVKLAASTKSF
jgi:hypothetical protein